MRLFDINKSFVKFRSSEHTDERAEQIGLVVSPRGQSPNGGWFRVLFKHLNQQPYICREDDIFEVDATDELLTQYADLLPRSNGMYEIQQVPLTFKEEAIMPEQPAEQSAPIEAQFVVTETTELILPELEQELSYTPVTLTFNVERYEAYAYAIKERYAGLILTEDNEKEIKSIKTTLAKVTKDLNQRRIEIEKQISQPIKDFKSQIDGVIAIINGATQALDAQLKSAEAQRKTEQRKQVQVIFDGMLAECGLPDKYRTQIILRDEYTNKSFSMKKIREDIKDQIDLQNDHYQNELAAQQAEKTQAKAREMVFDAMRAVYPNVTATVADAYGVPTENLAVWFKEQNDKILAALEPVPERVSGYHPVHDETIVDHGLDALMQEDVAVIVQPTSEIIVEYHNPALDAPSFDAPVFNTIDGGIPPQPTHAPINLSIYHVDEMTMLMAAQEIVDTFSAKGISVTFN